MPLLRHRHMLVALVTLVTVGCSTSGNVTGQTADPAAAASTGGATVVDACPTETPTSPPPTGGPAKPGSTPGSADDPRQIIGPSTAALQDEDVRAIVNEAQPSLPVTVRSCDDVDVEVTDVSRILAVDLYGTLAEVVFSLGLGDNVVGRDTSTGFTQAADLPVVTPGGHDLSAEAILELNPSVVLTDSSIGPIEVQQQLRDSGIPVIFFDPARTLAGVPDQIRAVAGALGVPDDGEQLVERVGGEIADALALAPRGVDPLRMTFLYIRGTAGVYLMSGPGSGADSLISSIGAVDVGTDIGLDNPFTPLTSEALISAAPDVIVMMTAGLESVGGVDGLLEIPGIAQTPAGERRRIVDMEDTDLLTFGPRSGDTIKALAEAVYTP